MSRQDETPLYIVRAYYVDTLRALSRAYHDSPHMGHAFPHHYWAFPKSREEMRLRVDRFRCICESVIDELGAVAFYMPAAFDVLECYANREPFPPFSPEFPAPTLHNYAMYVSTKG